MNLQLTAQAGLRRRESVVSRRGCFRDAQGQRAQRLARRHIILASLDRCHGAVIAHAVEGETYAKADTAIAAVIEGRTAYAGRSDLSRSFTLTGQYGKRRSPYGVLRGRETARFMASDSPTHKMSPHYRRNLGNPNTGKVLQGRPRQNNRCAYRSVRHHERPLPRKASRLRDSSAGFCLEETMGLKSGGSEAWQGTLTITGSNVRLGTEMPVALSSFSL